MQPFKDAIDICKTIRRNGYDAYVINAPLQHALLEDASAESELDIATDMEVEDLIRLFPNASTASDDGVIAALTQGGTVVRFYPSDDAEGSHPEVALARMTPRMLRRMERRGETPANLACPYVPRSGDIYSGFKDFSSGVLQFEGLPDETLKRNYLLAIRALRFAANYSLDIEPNTRMSIVRGSRRVLDYVSVSDIVDEIRKVEAENLWQFFRLLYDTRILHGLIPEIANLSRVIQVKNESGDEERVFDHTIEVMRRYPEELPYDWFGTMACLFHDVGKLYTAEFFDGKWTFHQHQHVGAKVTRKILSRLRFEPNEIDLICHLVRQHMRFHFMLTDKGIRRFKALDEYPRLIELARADLKARGGNYTDFNHNMKYLERADTPEDMLEPLLNGREIMDFTGLKPGPAVGVIREALLKAQIAGEVSSVPGAVEYVMGYVKREGLA